MSASEKGSEKQPIVVVKTGDPVQNVRERRGEFHDLIREAIGDLWPHGYDVVDVREEGAVFPDPKSASAFVITGSAANVPNREPWMLRTEAWLRDVVAAGTPTFGICFGHQILAQALGGEVQMNPRGREMGTVPIEQRVEDWLFEGVPRRFFANVTHLDTVARLPEGAVSLARSPLEDNHAIRFTETCVGVQFHPEIDGDVMRTYVEARREILASEGFDVGAMLREIENAYAGRQTLLNFVRRFLR